MKLSIFLTPVIVISLCHTLFAQQASSQHGVALQEVFRLALANSYQLKAGAYNVQQARQQIEIEKLEKLPQLNTDMTFGYISNADVWNPTFTVHSTGIIPHHYTDFSFLAEETVFKGGQVKNTLKKSELAEEVARLDQEKNKQDIKLLVAGNTWIFSGYSVSRRFMKAISG